MSKIFNKLKKGTLFCCSYLFNKIKGCLSIIKNKENKIDISLLTSKEIEEELKRRTYKKYYLCFDYNSCFFFFTCYILYASFANKYYINGS